MKTFILLLSIFAFYPIVHAFDETPLNYEFGPQYDFDLDLDYEGYVSPGIFEWRVSGLCTAFLDDGSQIAVENFEDAKDICQDQRHYGSQISAYVAFSRQLEKENIRALDPKLRKKRKKQIVAGIHLSENTQATTILTKKALTFGVHRGPAGVSLSLFNPKISPRKAGKERGALGRYSFQAGGIASEVYYEVGENLTLGIRGSSEGYGGPHNGAQITGRGIYSFPIGSEKRGVLSGQKSRQKRAPLEIPE